MTVTPAIDVESYFERVGYEGSHAVSTDRSSSRLVVGVGGERDIT
jgi:hypothetical protein